MCANTRTTSATLILLYHTLLLWTSRSSLEVDVSTNQCGDVWWGDVSTWLVLSIQFGGRLNLCPPTCKTEEVGPPKIEGISCFYNFSLPVKRENPSPFDPRFRRSLGLFCSRICCFRLWKTRLGQNSAFNCALGSGMTCCSKIWDLLLALMSLIINDTKPLYFCL
jgi:hypothetical protein